MGKDVVGIVFLFFSLIIYSIFYFVKKAEKNFQKDARYTYAKAIGRDWNCEGNTIAEWVMIVEEDGSEKEVVSQQFCCKETIPQGEMVKVAYVCKELFGIRMYELRIVDERFVKAERISLKLALNILFIVFAIIALILFL